MKKASEIFEGKNSSLRKTFEEATKPCKQCDYKNPVRFGRADWRCKDCGRNLMLELVLMKDAMEKIL